MSHARASRRLLLASLCVFALATASLMVPGTTASAAGKATTKRKTTAKPPARNTRSGRSPKAAPAGDTQRTWADARALADAGHYDDALAVLHVGLQKHPGDTDLLWLEAACAGWAGRHAEAIVLYERLANAHPELASDLRTDLATERLWSGDPSGAVRDLDRRLAESPGDHAALVTRALALSYADRLHESLAAYDSLLAATPLDGGLELERARVLMWLDRNTEACRAYAAVLAREPKNDDARLGLAKAQNAAGLHRHAIATLQPLTSAPDADPEALKTLAFAHYWSGDPELGLQTLAAYRAKQPDDREGGELEQRIHRETSASLTLGYGRADDTDGLRVGTTNMELGLPLGTRNNASLGWQRDNVSDPLGTQDPLQWRAGLQTIWSAQWVTHANVSVFQFESDGPSVGHGELALTWRPEDRLRIDGGMSRDAITTRRSLALGVSAQTWVAGVDVQACPRLMLHADVRQRFFSDDNRAQAEAVSAHREVYADRQWRLALEARLQQLRTRLDLDHGYYDPAQYLEWGPGADADWTPRPNVTVNGEVWTGWQRERNAEARPMVNVSGRIEWVVERFATLALEGGRSNSNLQSASGYERRQWAVSITKGF